ncbi:hypothetical protein [Legionella sp. PL877]|uniref:hypothetical protein n=2 Tax=unclassified Legionella TaxID=2622702 RepID=UPI0010550899|nr:hypothetical protein [Legionella sp. PL877]MDI9818294.1 hypothetical protein [Legionella sp. PL877]
MDLVERAGQGGQVVMEEVLTNLRKIIQSCDWTKEVRYNGIRQFSRMLVFFTTPDLVPPFEEAVKSEFLKPKGIIAMEKILEGNMDDEEKITSIKSLLLEKGYNGDGGTKSWKRTLKTHAIYGTLAKIIANYDNEQRNTDVFVV